MREYLLKTQSNIDKIEKRLVSDKDVNKEREVNLLNVNNYANLNKKREDAFEISDEENNNNTTYINPNINLVDKYKTEDESIKKIKERIKFFRQRCESALGYKLYIKAYEYLFANRGGDLSLKRDHLISKNNNLILDLFGKNNIGFWQIIDQILFLEDLLNN